MYKLLLISCFFLWVVLPATLFKPNDTGSYPILLASLYHFYLFGWIVAAAIFLRRRSQFKYGLSVLAVVAGLYYSVTYLLMAYSIYAGHVFDLRFALDSYRDAPTTVLYILGPLALLLLVAFAALWFGFTHLIHRLALMQWGFETAPGFVLIVLGVCIGLVTVAPGSPSYVGQSLANEIASLRYYSDIHPTWETTTAFPGAQSDENLFFLQLESVNALAAFGNPVIDGKRYDGSYLPQLEKAAKQGVLFRFAWGNTIQTARATEAVLCGVSNNVGPPLTFQPGVISAKCLPELLRSAGFSTSFFPGSVDVDFHNTASFLREKGIDNVIGPEVMKDLSQARWGYEECEFFQRVFRHLGQQNPNPKRLFVHIAVSRHHLPFKDDVLDSDRPFETPENFIEHYLNSLNHQDKCFGSFWKEFEDYAGLNSHLFVFGDHSWPVGISGNTFNETGSHTENFAVPILYIPPRNLREKFAVGSRPDVRIGQTDLPSTALDVLGLGTGPNSFLPILQGKDAPKYEECQVLVQPYTDPSIVVIRRNTKHTYRLFTRELTRSFLSESLEESEPTVVEKDIPYSKFRMEYGCERYRAQF